MVYEFVGHTGWFSVRLSNQAVGVGGSDSSFVNLQPDGQQGLDLASRSDGPSGTFIDETQNAQTTRGVVHGMQVRIPSNFTCDHCTLQVRQWAPTFNWYYYACADVAVYST